MSFMTITNYILKYFVFLLDNIRTIKVRIIIWLPSPNKFKLEKMYHFGNFNLDGTLYYDLPTISIQVKPYNKNRTGHVILLLFIKLQVKLKSSLQYIISGLVTGNKKVTLELNCFNSHVRANYISFFVLFNFRLYYEIDDDQIKSHMDPP